MMKILFDWDDPDLNWVNSLKRGIELIVYGLCKPFGIRFKFIEEIYTETDKYVMTITKLNRLLGIDTIYGIRDCVSENKPHSVIFLKNSGQDVRRHIHIGKKGLDRQRLWEPSLTQSINTWHFAEDYHNGIKIKLKKGELPIFHIDRPYRLSTYIDFLYENRSELKK